MNRRNFLGGLTSLGAVVGLCQFQKPTKTPDQSVKTVMLTGVNPDPIQNEPHYS